MSLNLIIYPLVRRGAAALVEPEVFCPDRLCFDQDYELFSQLTNHRSGQRSEFVKDLPKKLWILHFTETGIKRTRKDPLGTNLTYLPAGDFQKFQRSSKSSVNKGIFAYLAKLPKEIPVILYWE